MPPLKKWETSVTNELLDKGFDLSTTDKNGHTAFWTAMEYQLVEMVALLRKKGVKERFRDGSTNGFDETLRQPAFYTPPCDDYDIPEGQEYNYQLAIGDCNHLVVPHRTAQLYTFGPIGYAVGVLKDKHTVPEKHHECMEKMGFRRVK